MKEYRMIVAGGRDFLDEKLLTSTLDGLREDFVEIEIVSGHASGADRMAEAYTYIQRLV